MSCFPPHPPEKDCMPSESTEAPTPQKNLFNLLSPHIHNFSHPLQQNSFVTGVYPASPSSWLFMVTAILVTQYSRLDPSMGMIGKIKEHLPVRYEEGEGERVVVSGGPMGKPTKGSVQSRFPALM